MPQIALVTDEHDDDVRVCVVAEFLQPAKNVDVSRVFRDIVHEKCSDSASVVPVRMGDLSVAEWWIIAQPNSELTLK